LPAQPAPEAVQAPEKWKEGDTILVESLVVEMPRDAGIQMAGRLRDPRSIESAVADIWDQLAEDTVVLISIATTRGAEGTRTCSWSFDEILYPTEFDPPTAGIGPNGLPIAPAPVDYSRYLNMMQIVDVPIAFDTRNLGFSLQFDTEVERAGSDLISLSLGLKFDELREMKRFLDAPPSNQDHRFAQPLIRTERVTTDKLMVSGKWELSHLAVEPSGAIRLFLLRCTKVPSNR
jgi:hypothetical protein